jgi:hypothetical protein
MLSTPFIIDWPDDLENFPFASKTSLISEEILEKEVNKRANYASWIYEKLSSCGGA